jgi:hypothetical protein
VQIFRTYTPIVERLNSGDWSPDYSTGVNTAPGENQWAKILTVQVGTHAQVLRYNVPYIVYGSGGEVFGGGYLFIDIAADGKVTITVRETDGASSILLGGYIATIISASTTRYDFYFHLRYVSKHIQWGYEVETVMGSVTPTDNAQFVATSDVITSSVVSASLWATNDNGDVYVISNEGKIGIGTGPGIDTNAKLNVAGNVVLSSGDVRIKRSNEEILWSSNKGLGYIFQIKDIVDGKTPLFISNDGSIGINTNLPKNRLHVNGFSQFTGRMSIGAGDSPLGKLHIRGEGITHQTLALFVKNRDGMDLLRVHDDGAVWVHHLENVDPGDLNLKDLTFGNGLTATPTAVYDGTAEINVKVGDLLASPTGTIYTG